MRHLLTIDAAFFLAHRFWAIAPHVCRAGETPPVTGELEVELRTADDTRRVPADVSYMFASPPSASGWVLRLLVPRSVEVLPGTEVWWDESADASHSG